MNVEHLLNDLEGLVHHLPHSVQGPLTDVIETVRHIYEATVLAITPHEPVHDGSSALISHHQRLQELQTQLSTNTTSFQLVYQGDAANAYHTAASASLEHLQTTLDHISFASQQHDSMSLQFSNARSSQLLLIIMLGVVVITLASIPATAGIDSEVAVPAAVGETAGGIGIIASLMEAITAAGTAITALEADSTALGMLAMTIGALLDRPQTIDPDTTETDGPPSKPPTNPNPNNLLQNIINILGPAAGAIKIAEILADDAKKQQLIDALKKAYPECDGIIDWEKFLEAHPDWTLQDMTNYLQALQDAQSIMDQLNSLENDTRYKNSIDGKNGWRKRIETPLNNLLKMLYNGKATPAQVDGAQNNLKGVWYELFLAMQFGQKGTLTNSGIQVPLGDTKIDVDLVLDGGSTWAEVKNQGPMTSGSKRWDEFQEMVESRFKAAQENGIDEFDFYLYSDKGNLTQEQIDLINHWSQETGINTKIITDIKPGTIPPGSAWCTNAKTPTPQKTKSSAPPTSPTPTPTPSSSKPPAGQPGLAPTPTPTPTS